MLGARIKELREAKGLKERKHWDEYFNWCVNTVEKFSSAFKKYL